MKHPIILAVGSFLAAWSISDFAPDYRSILTAILVGVFGYATPKKKK